MKLDECIFIKELEDCTLPSEQFNHVGHLWTAWIYLKKFSLEEAISKTSESISRFAISAGATGKFHQTLTEATVIIISQRLSTAPNESFSDFLKMNNDLVENLRGVVLTHYSPELLDSSVARASFIQPDILGFNNI